MAYNAVPTAVTGDLWTAANHNTYIKDNFAAGVPDIFTAQGDLTFATGANAASPLAIGAAGHGLFVNDGATAPEWRSTLIGCGLSVTTDQTITAGSTNTVSFDTENYDTNDLWSSSDPDGIVIPRDGIYQCSGIIDWGIPPSQNIYLFIGTTRIWHISEANTTYLAVNYFTYTSRFSQGDNPCLVINAIQWDAVIKSAEYSVTYLGAST